MKPIMMLADITPTVEWKDTGAWLIGFLGVLGCVYLLLAVANQAKKLFGRRPPVDETIEALRGSVRALDAKYEEKFQELQADRLRAWKELTDSISTVAQDVAYLRGKMDPHYKRTHRL